MPEMDQSIQPVAEIDGSKDAIGDMMYRDDPNNVSTPAPQTPIDHAMLRRLENKWDAYRLAGIVRRSAQQVKKLSDEEGKRIREQADQIDSILEELSRVTTITSRFVEKVTLKRILDVLRLPEYKMSIVTNTRAERLFQEFERQKWGERVVLVRSTDSSKPIPTASAKPRASRLPEPASGSSDFVACAASMEASSFARSSAANTAQTDVKQIVHFSDDHPVFGSDGLMRGVKVRVNKTKNKVSYFLSQSQTHKRADIVGHNKLTVGDCWPYMICLIRDGVHGCTQGGIYGNEATGAYSIIVLGESAYAEMDRDSGSRLLYSGSGSLENSDPNHARATTGTKALQASALKKQAVRVIRGKNRERNDSPKAGFRYDGLYKVVAQKELKNGKGGAFVQFELRRLENQAPIDTSRPDAQEQKAFQDIKAVKLRC